MAGPGPQSRPFHAVVLAALAVLAGIPLAAPPLARGQEGLERFRLNGVPQSNTSAATSSAGDNVAQIRIVGNNQVPEGKILREIKTRAGRPFDPQLIEEDVRRLNRTRLFLDVSVMYQPAPRGRIVIFQVVERPTLHYVKFVGNQRVRRATLAKEVELKPGDSLDLFAVDEARRRLEMFYRSHGFPNARITLAEGTEPTDEGAVFLINEGTRQQVLWTNFEGNTVATDARLRTQIQSKPGILWIFKGEVDRKQIEEDRDRLIAYYRSLGYFRARVGHPLTELHSDPTDSGREWLTLTYVIDEGPRYVVRNVSFVGNERFASAELADAVKLKSNEFFDQTSMNADVLALRDMYGSEGYVFADIQADPRFLEEPGKLDLVYQIEEGQRYRVGRIDVEIAGDYPHTRLSTVLTRMGEIYPGEILDTSKLREAERRLRRSQLFETNPAMGNGPKIVFSPPEFKDLEEQVAEGPHSHGGARFQSPEPRRHTTYRPPAGTSSLDRLGAELHRALDAADRPIDTSDRRGVTVRAQSYSPNGGTAVPPYEPYPTAQSYPPAGSGSSQDGTTTTERFFPQIDGTPTAVNPAVPWDAPPPGQYPVQQASSQRVVDDPRLWGLPPDQDPLPFLPLGVKAAETRTGRFMFSVGVNSDAGLLGSIIIDEQNFDLFRCPTSWADVRNATAWRGRGQRLRIEAVPGTQVQRYTINFQEPYLLGSQVSLGLSGFYFTRFYQEWDEQRIGGRVALGYQFPYAPDLAVSCAFRGMKVTLSDLRDMGMGIPDDLAEAEGDNSLYGFQVGLTHDTRDSTFLATEGHILSLSFEQVIGSFEYPRAEVDYRRYFMLHQRPDGSGRHVISVGGRVGITGDNTPIYEHYFAGGYSTIRGFDFRGASHQELGVRVGGHFMLLGSVEYMFPITADDMIRGVVFCDTGTVEPSIDDWTDNYRVAPGFGLRITVPAMGPAPIALDFAFPVSSQSGDDEEVFSFFIGFLR